MTFYFFNHPEFRNIEATMILIPFFLGIMCLCYGLYRLYGPVSVTYISRYSDLRYTTNGNLREATTQEISANRYGVKLREFNHLVFPISIFWVSLFFALLFPKYSSGLLIFGLVNGFLGSLSTIFFKINPSWLRWLKKEHGDIWDILQMEIEKEGENNWDKRINTPEELHKWVLQVRQKHGL